MSNEHPVTTRRDNADGTHEYRVDDVVSIERSRVLYTHSSNHALGDGRYVTLFHKSESAAMRATYKYGTRVNHAPIERVVDEPTLYNVALSADELAALLAAIELNAHDANDDALVSAVDKLQWLRDFIADPVEHADELDALRVS